MGLRYIIIKGNNEKTMKHEIETERQQTENYKQIERGGLKKYKTKNRRRQIKKNT